MSETKEKISNIEATELSNTNSELAAFLGENPSENVPAVLETIETEVIENSKMNVQKPDNLSLETEEAIKNRVDEFIQKVKSDPTDMTLSSDVYRIGQKAAEMAIPHVSLYDNLIAGIMEDNQKGENIEGSKDSNLLKLKQQLDLINPAVLSKTPIKQKFLLFMSKSSLPGTDKVMDIIYENKETVKSSIDGIKVALLQNANDLDKQLADLMLTYKGLLNAHMVLKSEIYLAQLIYNEVATMLETITDSIAKQNVETVLADLTTQINSLIVEENMNAQFFAGSQLTAKLVREQQNQIRILVRQMENAVLANLGLRVVAKSLEKSVQTSKALGSAISDTIADTAVANEKTANELQKARTEGYIDLKKLQEGVDALERTFKQESKANELIIKQGLVVSKNVRTATNRLEQRVTNNIDSKKS